MARIRTLKPEILEDQKTGSLSHEAFRLFIGMICLSDDHGGIRTEIDWLRGQIFWGSPSAGDRQVVEDAIEELSAVGLIGLYEVRGQRYAQITGWEKHQRVDHPGKPRVPRPDEEGAWHVPSKHPTMVYFIQAENSRAIKIGVSWNPARRLAEVQNGHHERLSVIAAVPGGTELERALHREFASSRMSGEWFRCSVELLDRIEELKSAAPPPESPRETPREPSRDTPRTLATEHRTSDHDHDRDLIALTAKPKRERKVPLPDDWRPTPEHIALAIQQGVDVAFEAANMRDWSRSKGRGSWCIDWNARFSNWLRSARPRNPARAAVRGLSTEDILHMADDLERRGL